MDFISQIRINSNFQSRPVMCTCLLCMASIRHRSSRGSFAKRFYHLPVNYVQYAHMHDVCTLKID